MRALRIHPQDTTATLLDEVAAGDEVKIVGDDGAVVCSLTVAEPIAMGHKISLEEVREGDVVVKYGEAIGAAIGAVAEGSHLHVHNVKSRRIR